jgi:DNA polymerase III delta prime subunit
MDDPPIFPPGEGSDPSFRSNQNSEGNQNLLAGQVTGGVVINHLTINERIPAESAPPPLKIEQSFTRKEDNYRKVLLTRVKSDWVQGFEKSLYNSVLIELGLKERLDLVKRSSSGFTEFPETAGEILPKGSDAIKVFNQTEVGRTLLILGEPGSGKTITLLKLAEELIARTEKDSGQPIPVVFNLSSWAIKSQTIKEWLVQELSEKYLTDSTLGRTWIEKQSLILLLDGLDEVKAGRRGACVQALNQFMQTHGTTEVAICCRIRDYEALKDRLTLRSAICIQPLTSEHVNSYFEAAGSQLSALKQVWQKDRELQELAVSPLMLNIMSLAYQNCQPDAVATGGTIEDYRKRLFNTYIARMFQRRGNNLNQARSQQWLIWLAQRMNFASQTEFLIERLQPSWLPTKRQRIFYRLESGVVGGLSIILISELFESIIYGKSNKFNWDGALQFYLTYGVIMLFMMDIRPVETLKFSWQKVRDGLSIGLVTGVVFGIVSVIYAGLTDEIPSLISADEDNFDMSLFFGSFYGSILGVFFGLRGLKVWQKVKQNQDNMNTIKKALIIRVIEIVFFAIVGMISGYHIINWLIITFVSMGKMDINKLYSIINFIAFGTGLMGMFCALVGGLIGGFRGQEIESRVKPNQGIWNSAQNSIIAGIIIFVILGFTAVCLYWKRINNLLTDDHETLWVLCALIFIGMLIYGGNACIRHVSLRFMLYRLGYSPWNYSRFLNNSTDLLFLKRAGGSYSFVHRMLLEHFAEMPLELKRPRIFK